MQINPNQAGQIAEHFDCGVVHLRCMVNFEIAGHTMVAVASMGQTTVSEEQLLTKEHLASPKKIHHDLAGLCAKAVQALLLVRNGQGEDIMIPSAKRGNPRLTDANTKIRAG